VVSLGAVTSPGEMGADIVVGEGQSMGNALNFGGPYLGLFATRQKYVRQMPGRLCGQTVDRSGRRGYVLTLSTREQHIRREKATSNICTNSGLCTLAFCIHLALLGETGLRQLARINHGKAVQLAEQLAAVNGVEVVNETFFNEFTLRLSRPAAAVVSELVGRGVMGGVMAGVPVSRLHPDNPNLANLLLVATTETNTDEDVAALLNGLREVL
jgi:glycine dehydrogenase subunit 1